MTGGGGDPGGSGVAVAALMGDATVEATAGGASLYAGGWAWQMLLATSSNAL